MSKGSFTQPPPSATTISSRSPSATSVAACALRGTISPFRSTAIFLPASSRRASSAAISSGCSKRCALPFTVTWITRQMILEAPVALLQALRRGDVAVLALDHHAALSRSHDPRAATPPQPSPDDKADRQQHAERERSEHQDSHEKREPEDHADDTLNQSHSWV